MGILSAQASQMHWSCNSAIRSAVLNSVGVRLLRLPPLLARATTVHYFDPCELLEPDARSEIKKEHRRRARGGGWELAD